MKSQFSVCALLLMALSPVSAQLATSHVPTDYSMGEATPPMQVVGKAVARVNGTVLTDQDLQGTMYAMFPYARQHNGAVPKALEADIRAGAMKMMVFEELVYQEALRRKMTISPEKLQKAESDFAGRFDGPSEFQRYVQTEFHGSRPLLRSKIRRSLLIEAFLKTEIDQKATVSAAELKEYYGKNPGRFQINESFAFQTISILPPANATPDQLKEARKRADEALRQAKTAKTYQDFGLLAEKYSDDDYRVMMGDHKAVERAKLPPSAVQALLALKPGQVSDLIQVDNAYTIVRLNKHIMAGELKFEDVKADLRKEMVNKKIDRLRSALNKKLHQNAKIEVL
jgi:peptidyl-prolyl cis-trans isomerase SurA